MGKVEKTVTTYTCDRCGEVINENARRFWKHGYFGCLRWYVPSMAYYKMFYLCKHCCKELNKFLGKEFVTNLDR